MITPFTRDEARNLMDQVLETLKPLGVDLNISFASAGGRFEGSKFTLKIIANKLDEDGSVTSDRRTDDGVRWAFERGGVKVLGEVIGSIWKRADGTLAQVVDYHRTRKKYPIEFRKVGGEHKLAPVSWFAGATQVTQVSYEDFYFWCRVDPELLSDKDMERFDSVNDWLTLYVPEKQQDAFFDAVSRVLEKRVTQTSSEKLLLTITQTNVPWDLKIHQLNTMAE